MRALPALALLLLAEAAHANPVVLRIANVAPEGSAWAREFHAFVRDVDRRTEGRVQIKLYLGGIAGDDMEALKRIERGQLEGTISGGPGCGQTMPTLRVLQVPGLFQEADEAKYVVNQLVPRMIAEAREAGYVYLASAPLGAGMYFGRRPVTRMAELRRTRLWMWDLEATLIPLARSMGLTVAPAPLEQAGRDFDEGKIDGFWALPTAALAFQWSVRAPYLVDLRGEYLFGCAIVTSRAFGMLSAGDQRMLAAAGAQLAERFDAVSRQQEETLLHGGFQHQGVQVVPVSEAFRGEFFEAARLARERQAPRYVPKALLDRVEGLLGDYRAEHRATNPN